MILVAIARACDRNFYVIFSVNFYVNFYVKKRGDRTDRAIAARRSI
ncbi:MULTISPECIES: hypothetical protein [unclassified Microcoleus]|nr:MULTISPECIES: hypothetical protein [unclassified Microcoleus]